MAYWNEPTMINNNLRTSTKPFEYIMNSRIERQTPICISRFQNIQGTSVSTNRCVTGQNIDVDTFLKYSPYSDVSQQLPQTQSISYLPCTSTTDLMQTTKLQKIQMPEISLRHDNGGGVQRSMYMNIGRDTQREARDNYRLSQNIKQ